MFNVRLSLAAHFSRPPTQNKWEYTYNGSKSAPTTRTQHTAKDGIGGTWMPLSCSWQAHGIIHVDYRKWVADSDGYTHNMTDLSYMHAQYLSSYDRESPQRSRTHA